MNATTLRPASGKQFAFIRRLLSEREVDDLMQEMVDTARGRAMKGTMSSSEASELIDDLLDLPKRAPEREDGETDAGIYRGEDGTLYRVYLGQQSGRMLTKVVTIDGEDVHYDYLGAAARVLPGTAERLTVEEVGALGVVSGTCIVCGRALDDPESVDRGVGPTCAMKY